MKNVLIKFAKSIYKNTSSPSVRSFYFKVFCYMVRNKKLMANADGINYFLDLGEMIELCIFLGQFEPEMKLAIQKFAKPGDTILDIGANIGAHTFNMAKTVGSSGVVYAFEPTEYAFRKLLHNSSLNPTLKVHLFRLALSDSNAENQTISFNSSWPTIGERTVKYCQADFERLDDWAIKNNVSRIDLIKLDVDGNEFSVINGAKNSLTRHKPTILIEVWGLNFADDSRNPFRLLSEIGYSFYNIESETKYQSLDDLRLMVTKNGELADFSINVYAKHDEQEPRG